MLSKGRRPVNAPDWIETVERLEEMMDQYVHLRQKARDVFELRYKETIDPDKNPAILILGPTDSLRGQGGGVDRTFG
jgi:hypothetical protein